MNEQPMHVHCRTVVRCCANRLHYAHGFVFMYTIISLILRWLLVKGCEFASVCWNTNSFIFIITTLYTSVPVWLNRIICQFSILWEVSDFIGGNRLNFSTFEDSTSWDRKVRKANCSACTNWTCKVLYRCTGDPHGCNRCVTTGFVQP